MAAAVIALAAVLRVLLGGWAGPLNAQSAKPAVVWAAADLKWVDNPSIKGGKVAVLWGDPSKGAYGALKRLPGGTTVPAHTHTHDQKIIEVTGTVVVTVEGGAPKDLGPGSYALFPGGVKHTANCKAGADCLYFEEQPGKADLKTVQ